MAEGGDLLDYIMAKGKLREARSRRLFRDITKAVCYLHEMKISHRDLKGENVLLKMNQRVSQLQLEPKKIIEKMS